MSTGTVLVTGGAGYIGSHAVMALLAAGHQVVVVDDLSTGNREVVPEECAFIQGNAGDQALIAETIRDTGATSVMHFAGSLIVEESMSQPLKYYKNNTCVSRNLIETCIQEGVGQFIFSSTAAVYGNPASIPVDESASLSPINPYGQSKAMTELILRDACSTSSMRYIALRYFNVAGADPGGRSGQIIKKATHLIKVGCELALGKRKGMSIYGTDYPTPDGTCVRDYIHVSDLAEVHVMALEYLRATGSSQVINCGYGTGYSVREVLDTLQKIIGKRLNIMEEGRRPGDPAGLVADNRLLRSLIPWQPKCNKLEQIIEDALRWEQKLDQP